MYNEIKDKIKKYIINKAEIQQNDDDFTDNINLYKYGYLDSIDSMSILSFIETEFKIQITKEDIMLNNMETIEEIVQMVLKKINNR